MKHILKYLVLTLLVGAFLACEKDDELVNMTPATGEYDGVYADSFHESIVIIGGSEFTLYEYDYEFDEVTFVTGFVNIEGQLIYDSDMSLYKIHLDANVTAENTIQGTFEISMGNTTDFKGLGRLAKLEQFDERSNTAEEGFYEGKITKPYWNSDTDVSFIAVVYGKKIMIVRRLIGFKAISPLVDGSFDLVSEDGQQMQGTINNGLIMGTYIPRSQGEPKDITANKYHPKPYN